MQEYAPRVLVGLAIVILGSSAGSYLFGVSDGDRRLTKKDGFERAADQPAKLPSATSSLVAKQPSAREDVDKAVSAPRALTQDRLLKPPAVAKPVGPEPVYFCGAQTKKGTACSRRVKGNARCFQHAGMPAMLTSNGLKAGG